MFSYVKSNVLQMAEMVNQKQFCDDCMHADIKSAEMPKSVYPEYVSIMEYVRSQPLPLADSVVAEIENKIRTLIINYLDDEDKELAEQFNLQKIISEMRFNVVDVHNVRKCMCCVIRNINIFYVIKHDLQHIAEKLDEKMLQFGYFDYADIKLTHDHSVYMKLFYFNKYYKSVKNIDFVFNGKAITLQFEDNRILVNLNKTGERIVAFNDYMDIDGDGQVVTRVLNRYFEQADIIENGKKLEPGMLFNKFSGLSGIFCCGDKSLFVDKYELMKEKLRQATGSLAYVTMDTDLPKDKNNDGSPVLFNESSLLFKGEVNNELRRLGFYHYLKYELILRHYYIIVDNLEKLFDGLYLADIMQMKLSGRQCDAAEYAKLTAEIDESYKYICELDDRFKNINYGFLLKYHPNEDMNLTMQAKINDIRAIIDGRVCAVSVSMNTIAPAEYNKSILDNLGIDDIYRIESLVKSSNCIEYVYTAQ